MPHPKIAANPPKRGPLRTQTRPDTRSDSSGFSVVGAGPGGLDEMRVALDPSRVWFGLLKFVIGSGSFSRCVASCSSQVRRNIVIRSGPNSSLYIGTVKLAGAHW